MLRLTALLGFLISIALASEQKIRYDNYRVYEVLPKTENEVQFLSDLDEASDSINFLEGIHGANVKVPVSVAPHKVHEFEEILAKKQILNFLVLNDLQKHLDTEVDALPQARSSQYDWSRYHTLDETYQWLESLAKKHPNVVQLQTAGQSYEGRKILGVKISHKSGNKGILIEGGIHAREWISPAAITFILNELLNSKNQQVREIAENYDWYIFPHTNPDGYVYTHTKDRMWRKTRSPQGSCCYGADPNRNWNYHWNEVGSSSSPCSEIYAGKHANSEIEVKTFSEYVAKLKGKLVLYISFHSYSQLLLFPYGFTKQHAKNHNDLQKIGNVAANALSKRYGTKYTVGNIYETIYPASGSSIDWAFGTLNVPLAYTYELRPKSGVSGFVLPPKEIVPTSEETLDSLVAMVQEAKKLGY